MTNPVEKIRQVVEEQVLLMQIVTRKPGWPKEKEDFVPIKAATDTLVDTAQRLLDAIIDDLEQDLQRELDNPFFSQTDYIIRKIAYYKASRTSITNSTHE